MNQLVLDEHVAAEVAGEVAKFALRKGKEKGLET